MDSVMIRVSPEVREKLNSLKENQKESYTDVMERVLRIAIDILPLSPEENAMAESSINELDKGDVVYFSSEEGNRKEESPDTLVSKTVFQKIDALSEEKKLAIIRGLKAQNPGIYYYMKKIPGSPFSSLSIEGMRILFVLKHETTIILSIALYPIEE